MKETLRIGFIGAGNIARRHYHQLHDTGEARVAALTEPSAESLERFYSRCPGADALPAYADYRDMIANETLDGVVVLSPHACHYEQIAHCLEQGLHVLSEKPMTCTAEHARALIAKAEEAGRVLMIAYQRHYDPQFRYIRSQIQQGALGNLQFVQATQAQEWLQLTENTWRRSLALGCGGQLNDSGSHLVDIVLWVTGLGVKWVFAKLECLGGEVDVNTTLSMEFDNGALGSMAIIGSAPAWREDVSFVGDAGALYLREDAGLIQLDASGDAVEVRLPNYAKDVNADFVDCMLGRGEPQTPAECGLRTIEVTEAAWKSAESGQAVTLG